MDPHRVQRILDLVGHAGGQLAQRRQLLRVAHQGLGGPDRIEIAQDEQGAVELGVGPKRIAGHRPLPRLAVPSRRKRDRLMARLRAPSSRTAVATASSGCAGRERIGEQPAGELPAEQPLGGGVGEAHQSAGPQEDHRGLELAGAFRARRFRPDPAVPWMRSPRPLHPLGEAAHVVARAEVDAHVPARETLDSPGDAAEVAEEDAPRAQAQRDREGEGAGAEGQASHQRLPQRLADEARRHADLDGAERALPEADGQADLVDLWRSEEQPGELRQTGRQHVVEERAGRATSPPGAPGRCGAGRAPTRRGSRRRRPRASSPPGRRAARGDSGPPGGRWPRDRPYGLDDVGGLVEELPREETALVGGAAQGEPGEGREVRRRRHRHDEEDDQREAEELAGTGAQATWGRTRARAASRSASRRAVVPVQLVVECLEADPEDLGGAGLVVARCGRASGG